MWILFIAAAVALQLYDCALRNYLAWSQDWWWPTNLPDVLRYVGVMGSVAAAALERFRFRLARHTAALAAVSGLWWFIQVEIWRPVGSWQHWNDIAPKEATWLVTLPMFVVVLIVSSLTGSLLAGSLTHSIRLALSAGCVALLGWYLTCAHPYDVTTIRHDGIDLRILHLEKQGLRIRETTVSMDSSYPAWIRESERRLFQFRWPAKTSASTLRPSRKALLDSLAMAVRVGGLKPLTGEPALPLSWNAEVWLIALQDRVYALPSQGTPEVRAFVQEVQQSPKSRTYDGRESDICLGFCFKPMVALGYPLRAARMRVLVKIDP